MSRHLRRFRTIQDWFVFEATWQKSSQKGRESLVGDLFQSRRKVYTEIETERGRPLLVYFADPEDRRKARLSAIDPNDIDGFADLANQCKPTKSVDVLLHSFGGSAEVTARIVETLRNRFDEVHFLIPHSAYSAATMLALSGDSITLQPAATLGPIDPQINGIPAANITRGFENAVNRIKENPATIPALVPLIERHTLALLEECNHATELSRDLASLWLKQYMLKDESDCNKIIEKAVKYFSDYDEHHTHGRPIGWSSLNDMGLKINLADGNLASLMWEAYILLKGFYRISSFAKLYENSFNLSYGYSIPPPKPKTPPPIPPEILEQIVKNLTPPPKPPRK